MVLTDQHVLVAIRNMLVDLNQFLLAPPYDMVAEMFDDYYIEGLLPLVGVEGQPENYLHNSREDDHLVAPGQVAEIAQE